MKNKFSTHRVIKDFGEARIGDTCFKSGKLTGETQFHSNKLFDSKPIYNGKGKLVSQISESRKESYWVEWLKDSEIANHLKEKGLFSQTKGRRE